VREAIHALKYKRQASLSGPLAEAVTEVCSLPDGMILCPVPMHPDRQRERGYNHAELLASRMATVWGLPVLPPGALRRTRATPAQVTLDQAERMANVRGAFAADASQGIRGRAIVLVDDVCTTGATLDACSAVLLAAGASEVYGLTVARTV
jgi:ComF family protein